MTQVLDILALIVGLHNPDMAVIKARMEPGNKTKRETKQNETRTRLCALRMFTSKLTIMSSVSKMMVRVSDSSSEETNMERLLAQVKRKRACLRLFRTEPSCSRISVSRLVDILYTLNA